jgi:hypothetical protein
MSYGIFIALLALSFISIYFNLRLRKNNFIRKMYFITQQVKGDLKQIGVKSDNKCIALAYKYLLKTNPELLKEQLKNRKPIFWWKIPATCDDEGYSKLVINGKAYDVLNLKKKGDFPDEKKEGE